MTRLKYYFVLSTILLSFGYSFSQTGEIRGFVYDKESGEPIIFTNVYFKGTTRGAPTDVNGYYSITKVEPGEYTAVCTYIGYDTVRKKINISPEEIKTINFYLTPSTLNINEIEVTGEKTERKTEVNVSEIKITPKQIDRIPAIGGEPDFAQYLQVLPGVIFTGDQGGQIYIRGGTPIQNKVLLDGMTIYNPFHSIGLFSVFDMDFVRNIDVYAGGFNAEYGNRISAIMDIQTRDGNRKNFGGEISISPITGKIQLEGPLKKWKVGEGSSSFLWNSRVSYLDKTSPVFYPHLDSSGLPYSFNDHFGKLAFNMEGGSKISLFGFSFNDNVDFPNSTKFHWDAKGGGTQFMLVPAQTSTTVHGNFAYSDYRITQQEFDDKPRFSYINGFEAGLDFSYFPGKNHIKYGIDISGFKTQFQFYNVANRLIDQVEYTTEMAGYVRYKILHGKWVFDPSFRLQYYASLQEISPEPRLGLKYNVSDYFRLKFAGGFFSQNLISARSDRDVVNLFYGILSGPDELPNYFDGEKVTSRLQKARHAILGFEMDITISSTINIEGYIKDYNQLTSLNRNKIFDDTPEFSDEPEYLKEDYLIETGKAYGVDFTYLFDKKNLYIWFVYSLGVVERYDGRITYHPHWDRRHNLNLLVNYQFGKNGSWEVSTRWNYGSGFPFTKTQGFYELLDFQKDGLNSDYTTNNGKLGIIYDEINQGRLPQYHRMDISLKKTMNFKKGRKMEVTGSVINVYNRKNIFYFNRVKYARVNQLPVLPSISLNYKF